ncbi:hypothetical protein CC78DRAFT_616402, partial [Lojkania enalia]
MPITLTMILCTPHALCLMQSSKFPHPETKYAPKETETFLKEVNITMVLFLGDYVDCLDLRRFGVLPEQLPSLQPPKVLFNAFWRTLLDSTFSRRSDKPYNVPVSLRRQRRALRGAITLAEEQHIKRRSDIFFDPSLSKVLDTVLLLVLLRLLDFFSLFKSNYTDSIIISHACRICPYLGFNSSCVLLPSVNVFARKNDNSRGVGDGG